MSKISFAFANEQSIKLIPFLMSGDPHLDVTLELIHLLADEGVSAIELGVPFSDPVADGPAIQSASDRALSQGVTVTDVLQLGKKVREQGNQVPLILFSYYNPLLQYGLERLVYDAVASQFDGIIVPDLPYEEGESLRQLGKKAGLPVIPLVAPTSRQRIKQIVSQAEGFVYCVSSLGVTGVRQQFAEQVEPFLQTVRELSPVPTAVGFGISSGEQVSYFSHHADGVIVGSALIRLLEDLSSQLMDLQHRASAFEQVRAFVRQLKRG